MAEDVVRKLLCFDLYVSLSFVNRISKGQCISTIFFPSEGS